MKTHQVILFTDIVGSTELYDRLGSEKALDLVKLQEELLFPVVESFDGRVVKTVGDGIMAVFALPNPALECALQMQRVLDAERRRKGQEPLSIRISLHLGEMIELESDVYGDAVNVASRMQSLAGANHIVVSRGLWDACSAQIRGISRSAGAFFLKGKKEKMEVFQVTWTGDFREYQAALPTELTFSIVHGSACNLPTEGLFISRGGFANYAKKHSLDYSEEELCAHNLKVTVVTVPKRPHQFFCLYDDRLWKEPSDELYRENLFRMFCEAQKRHVVTCAISPTGMVRGFSRVRSLRCTLDGYAQYLQFTAISTQPSIRYLYWEHSSSELSQYEINALAGALGAYVREQKFFADHYTLEKVLRDLGGSTHQSEAPVVFRMTLSESS